MADLWKPDTIEGYLELNQWLGSVKERSFSEWGEAMRWYAKNDLFFLLNFVASDGQVKHSQTGERFHFHQYYVDLCKSLEYQRSVGGGLDCSARGSAKSIVRTKLNSIQMILNYPDITIFIFSVQKNLAQKHLRLIKEELGGNKLLKILFDDILFDDPLSVVKEGSTVWSIEDGIRVKRQMIRSSQTVEAHAFFGGGPVGTRPDMICCDDIEHAGVVTTPENIQKLEDAYSQAVSLLTPVAIPKALLFITNTRFSEAGLIQHKMDDYMAKNTKRVRAIPGELIESRYSKDLSEIPECYYINDGTCPLGGVALYPFTRQVLEDKFEETKVKSEYSLQFALDYTAAEAASLSEANVQFYEESTYAMGKGKNIYICIDASRGVYDPTAIWVWGLGTDHRYYWLDAVCRKMDPAKAEFHNEIFMMVEKWSNIGKRVVEVRVEQLGGSMWADLIRKELRSRGCTIVVVPCTSVTQKMGNFTTGKAERIFQRWAPMLSKGEVSMPVPMSRGGKGINSQDERGVYRCLVDYFLSNELKMFPRSKHDDMLDAGALIHDMKANEERPIQWPSGGDKEKKKYQGVRSRFSWMSA